jgi:hypothetical protein
LRCNEPITKSPLFTHKDVRVNSPDSTVPWDTDFQEGFSVQLRLARHQGRLHGSASPPSAGRHIKFDKATTAAARDRKIAVARSAAAARVTRRRGLRWWSWPASCAGPTQIVGRSPCGKSRRPLPSAAMSASTGKPYEAGPWRLCSANRKPSVRVSFRTGAKSTPTRQTHTWPYKGHWEAFLALPSARGLPEGPPLVALNERRYTRDRHPRGPRQRSEQSANMLARIRQQEGFRAGPYRLLS